MKTKHRHYHSYLVRLWKESADAEWRASIQDIASGEFKYFAQLGELFQFMEQDPQAAPFDRSPMVSRSALAEL